MSDLYDFSSISLERLSTCHLDIQALFKEVIRYIDCSAIVGYRPEDVQQRAYADGASKLQWPSSKHNTLPSMAIDIAPYPIDWEDYKRFYYFGGLVKGIAAEMRVSGFMMHGLLWGGDWDGDNDFKDQHFNDLVHFELIEE